MTPTERALLVALASVICEGSGRIRLSAMIEAVKREDLKRHDGDRMPEETLEEYNARIQPAGR